MKITGIDIGEYRQFKNIKFDFTYPADHPKAGQPLEKVCFIGQSGTGKTTLLRILFDFFLITDDVYQTISEGQLYTETKNPYRTFEDIEILADIDSTIVKYGKEISDNKNSIFRHTTADSIEWIKKNDLYEIIRDYKKLCVYLDDSAVSQTRSLTINRNEKNLDNRPVAISLDEAMSNHDGRIKAISKILNSKVLDLSSIESDYLWQALLEDIDAYDKTLTKIVQNLVNKMGTVSKNRLLDGIEIWQKSNPNPKINIAQNCLNPILSKFHLEVDTDAVEALIVVKTKTGTHLPYNGLSTGTKQLLATSIPIYKSQIQKGVILFDEPERSLFPDVQRTLVHYYISLAPQAQFFFATHSPIIASAFEPCERFILFFNENGEVNYHTGVAPEGDDPNDILRQDFDMADLMLQKGLEAYEEYRQLAMQIRTETDEEKKNQLIVKRVELGNRYNFAGKYAKS